MTDAQADMIIAAIKENKDSTDKLGEKLDRHLERIYDDQTTLKVDVGKLKVKAGVWGLLGAFVGGLSAYASMFFKKIGG